MTSQAASQDSPSVVPSPPLGSWSHRHAQPSGLSRVFSVCDTVWYRPVSGTLPNIAYAVPIVTFRHTHVKALSCRGLGQALHSLESLFGTQAAWGTSLRPPSAPVLMGILVPILLSYF